MTDVGFIGLGRMGLPMATNLARAGFLSAVFNRSPESAQELAAATGAQACRTAAELAERVDIVITMLADDGASAEVYLGPDGVASSIRPGTTAVEMSTVGVDHIRRLAEELSARSCALLDVPVSGSVALARDASLTLMAGGDPGAFEAVEPVLRAVGSPIFHLGPSGCGAAMKLAVNAVVYGLNEALSEGLVLAERAGIARERAYEVVASSAVSAPFVHYRREAFECPGEVPVAFRLALAAKDLRLILGLADECGARMPQAELNLEVLSRAVEAGLGDSDVSAVAQLLREGEAAAVAVATKEV
jgi:3-hydroxyisobutyrate dehydrogenase-like beta-hydroxyacid dehydrogenase